MSKLFGKSSLRPSLLSSRVLAACALLLFATAFASAQTKLTIVRPVHDILQGNMADVDVKLERDGNGPAFKAFNLLITYDAAALTLEDVTPQMVSGCGWQYFHYQVGAVDSNSSGAVRVVAVADVDSIAGAPSCYLGPALGTLFTLHFRVSIGELFNCTAPPVQFYWSECIDNSFTTLAGDSLYLAQNVYPWDFMLPVYPVPSSLQTVTGVPNSCLAAPIGSLQPARGIDFHQGYVSIMCVDPIDWRGDINQNGISYENSDAVLFADYFFDGLSVFSPEPLTRNAQIAASDVNANGIVLEFRDLVCLAQVMAGNRLPIPRLNPNDTLTAIFTQNTAAKTVSVTTTADLAGALLSFSGDITPLFLPTAPADFFGITRSVAGGTLVLMISVHPNEPRLPMWFTYTGNGLLQTVVATDFADDRVSTEITFQNLSGVCGDVNNDNRINISDAVFIIAYIFAGGSAPPNPASADVNCSGSISVSDAVYLIRYIFAGGPAPCANCR